MVSKQLIIESNSRRARFNCFNSLADAPSESKYQTKIPHTNKTLTVSTVPSNTTRYFFEYILRFDLLSKLNYNNIMQVPEITKINILVHCVPMSKISTVSLGLECIIGQKLFSTILPDAQNQSFKAATRSGLSTKLGTQRKNERRTRLVKLKTGKNTGSHGAFSYPSVVLLCCSLRGRTKYNFLEKLICFNCLNRILSFNESEYNCKVQGREVQLTISNRELRLFPEIQNHFEFFESLNKIQIKLVTSARSEKETRLLWAGLKQKEI